MRPDAHPRSQFGRQATDLAEIVQKPFPSFCAADYWRPVGSALAPSSGRFGLPGRGGHFEQVDVRLGARDADTADGAHEQVLAVLTDGEVLDVDPVGTRTPLGYAARP